MNPAAPSPRTWRPKPWIASLWLRRTISGLILLYLLLALASLDIDLARIQRGFTRLFEANPWDEWIFLRDRLPDVLRGLSESLAMAVVATPLGILLSLPVALGAARNVSIHWVFALCRGLVVVSRGFHEIIIAIFFVKMFGFGPLAGVLTLSFATIGFYGKLLAEEIENTDREVLEALRATGSGWPLQMLFGILPQVRPRMLGLALYRFDINLRESTVIGLVGAGGIGATLQTTFDRYEYLSAAAIVAMIIGLVFVLEWASGIIRRRLL